MIMVMIMAMTMIMVMVMIMMMVIVMMVMVMVMIVCMHDRTMVQVGSLREELTSLRAVLLQRRLARRKVATSRP